MLPVEDRDLLPDYELFAGAKNYRGWLLAHFSRALGRRVLEVGSGVGAWAGDLRALDLFVSIDVSEDRLVAARRKHAGANARFLTMDICHADALSLKADGFDTILCVNTLEHIEDDSRALANMREILTGGGRLILVVPALRSLYGALDRRYGHHRRYELGALREALREAGFAIESACHMNAIGAVAWFFYGRVLGRTGAPTRSLALFDRLVPVCALVDRLSGPPLGLSIVAVCRKDSP
ncbi:MAG: class I SAM-dependent methyltransferase [Deltaproteobacteria bacterium]|nr:class I SAM-dependent methyltransferase [Deltaproteobacteria bacterium]